MTIDEQIQFFRAAHDSIGQRRKYSGLPYWVHTEEVLEIVQSFDYYGTIYSVGALGHDTLEDVAPENSDYSFDKLVEKFGLKHAKVILELTDVFTKEAYPALNRAARKRSEAFRLATISEEAIVIKLSDLISNSQDIAENDKGFAKTYLKEKEFILSAIAEQRPEIALLDIFSYTEKILLDSKAKVGL